MRRYSRQEILQESGARPEELAELEDRKMLVPSKRWPLFERFLGPEEYYTEDQLEVLRWILKTRRATEAKRK